jgi:hypothetical protein
MLWKMKMSTRASKGTTRTSHDRQRGALKYYCTESQSFFPLIYSNNHGVEEDSALRKEAIFMIVQICQMEGCMLIVADCNFN